VDVDLKKALVSKLCDIAERGFFSDLSAEGEGDFSVESNATV
jgi:hypothetical protein